MDRAKLRNLAFGLGLVPTRGESDEELRGRLRRVIREDLRAPTLEDVEAILRAIPGVERVELAEGVGELLAFLVVAGDSPELLEGVRDVAKRNLDGRLPAGIRVDVIVRPPGESGDAFEAAYRLGGLDAVVALQRAENERRGR